MLRKTSCREILITPSLRALIDEVISEIASASDPFELAVNEIPSLDAIYPQLGAESADYPFVKYPPNKPAKLSDVTHYIHSSGSTGFPKPIPQTNQAVMQWSSFPTLTDIRDRSNPPLRFGAMPLPPFHAFGVFMQLYIPSFALKGIALYPPTSEQGSHAHPIIPTSDNVLDHLRRNKCNAILVVPTFIEAWEQSKEAIEYLKTLEFVGFGGGPLPVAKGHSLVNAGVTIQTVYGATEVGSPTYMLPRESDVKEGNWDWIRFHKGRADIRWIDQHDGTYELQLMTTADYRMVVENIPGGYATSDLFERHPTKDDLFRIVGRVDDVLILASGEKTVPGPMESTIRSCPFVNEAVMFGRERNQVGVLVQPQYEFDVNDEAALAEFRNKIWSAVEEANENAPAFSRIFKEMIIPVRSDKPLPRSVKGTVARKLAIKLYEPEIEALYDTIEAAATAAQAVEPPRTWSEVDIEHFLVEHAKDINQGHDVQPTVDLFEQGFDSLSATFLRNRIIGALRSSLDDSAKAAVRLISQNIIFAYPTLTQLAAQISALVAHPSIAATVDEGKTRIESMITKYSSGLGGPARNGPLANKLIVLLTGSTGALGSHLLASLLTNPDVTRVYAFNRPSSGDSTLLSRQAAAFEDQGFDIDFLKSEKLSLVEGDAAQERLGLPSGVYDELLASTTAIIHNAWRLDFNLALSSFETNIRGTRNLVDFALASPHSSSLRFAFTSSIGSTMSWDRARGVYPEEVQYDASFAVGSGYGEAKYVAERILTESGLQTTSIRIGQVAGGHPNGAWSTTDWVPIFVKSSIALGALPDAQGLASWISMPVVSQGVLDVIFSTTRPPAATNLVHPKPVEWRLLINAIGQALSDEIQIAALPLVPFASWFSKLEERAKNASEEDIQRIPAIKLLEFFRALSSADALVRTGGQTNVEACGIPTLSTDKMQGISPAIASARSLGKEDARAWVRYWTTKGLFGQDTWPGNA
ncbi:hypothetical protein PLICRDRAFT_44986 [Plicaturopsis crispa FD-325 SS-3]|nr:hypothetical protein PLICRDRAFT_44986 [Plicaturopsis crispa FD-325 SS-3]